MKNLTKNTPIWKLKRIAKQRCKSGSLSHMQALDEIAVELGHTNWSRLLLKQCIENKEILWSTITRDYTVVGKIVYLDQMLRKNEIEPETLEGGQNFLNDAFLETPIMWSDQVFIWDQIAMLVIKGSIKVDGLFNYKDKRMLKFWSDNPKNMEKLYDTILNTDKGHNWGENEWLDYEDRFSEFNDFYIIVTTYIAYGGEIAHELEDEFLNVMGWS